MDKKPLVKLIKREELNRPKILAPRESESSPNRWSSAVRSWVSEFQRDRVVESTPAFDSLFKDEL